MAFSLEPSVEEIPVTLGLLQLELLVTTCRRQQLHLAFKLEVTAPFRYELRRAAPDSQYAQECVLRSNDLMDVTRFLGLDVHMSEPGYPNATSKPSEHLVEPDAGATSQTYILGPVPLKQGLPTPLVSHNLPHLDNGQLDHTSQQFRDRVQALRIKSGMPMMECKKALFQADGDGENSLAILAQPRYYRSTI